MEDILGLKPLVAVEFPWLPVLGLALGALALLVLLLAVLRKWWRRRPVVPMEVVPVVKGAGELALESLRSLEQSALVQRGESSEFYLQLEEILKRYLESSCHIPAMSATRTELQQMMARQGLAAWERYQMADLLERGTYAKFAGVGQFSEAMRADLQLLRAFIHDDSKVGSAVSSSVQVQGR